MTTLLITDATLLDLEAGTLHAGSSVRVDGDRIVEVAPGRTLTPTHGPAARRIDARGATVMPGLIDAHVHAILTTLDLGALAHRPATRLGIEAKEVLEGMLRRGFTTVRDAGGLDRGIAEALDAGLVRGPRVFRSGRVLSQTGGHGDTHPPTDDPHLCAGDVVSTLFAHIADGPDAVRRAVREELKGGAHQVKVMAGGGVATPSDPIDMVQYTSEEIRAAVQEAASRRTYAFAHAYVPDAIVQAVEAGVRSIEHGNLLDERAAAVMAQHGTFLVPTLVVYEQIAALGSQWGFPADSLAKLDQVQAAGKRAIRLALDAGVRVGFGTGPARRDTSRPGPGAAAPRRRTDPGRRAAVRDAGQRRPARTHGRARRHRPRRHRRPAAGGRQPARGPRRPRAARGPLAGGPGRRGRRRPDHDAHPRRAAVRGGEQLNTHRTEARQRRRRTSLTTNWLRLPRSPA